MIEMQEKIIIITGASSGFGKVTKEYLEAKGYVVYGTSRKGVSLAEVLEARIKQRDKPLPLVNVDLTSEISMKEFIERLLEEHGEIHALINNAGYGLRGPITKTPLKDVYDQFQVNFFAPHVLIHAVLPSMLERNEGYIINVGSIAGRLPLPLQPFYSASKAALDKYTQALAMQLRGTRVHATLIEPGVFKTSFQENMKFTEETKPKRKPHGDNPMKIARLIHKILRSKHPRSKYVLGRDARFFAFIERFLPNELKNTIIIKATMKKKRLPYV